MNINIICYLTTSIFSIYFLYRFILLLYQSSLQTKLFITLLIYSIHLLIENVVSSGLNLMHSSIHMKDISGLTSDFILLGIVFLSERLQYKAEYRMKCRYWCGLLFFPMGSIYFTTDFLMSSEQYLANIVGDAFLFAINLMAVYLYGILCQHFSEKSNINVLIQQNQAYINQFNLMKKSQESFIFLRHDMKNHIYSMKMMLKNGRQQELSNYLSNTLAHIDLKCEYVRTGNFDIDSLLNYKIYLAEKEGIHIEIDISIPEKLNIDVFDLNIILGNLLDNAVEAVRNSADKKITLKIQLDKSILYIRIDNQYDGKLNVNNGNLISIKKDSQYHGIGLNSIRNAIEKYEGIMDIDYTANLFSVSIMLYMAVS